MFHLFSLVVFFHPSFHFPLTAARPRKHRTLNFMEDGVTLIAVTSERLSLAMPTTWL